MRLWILLLAGAMGCNRIFGVEETGLREYFDAMPRPDADPRVDLDHDGIKDVEDPCIAPDTDVLIDSDLDGMPNGTDACPFDSGPQGDKDGDGIGDACDVEQDIGTANRVRCVMAFSDPDLDVQMWTQDGMAWDLNLARSLSAYQDGLLVSDWPFESPKGATGYDIIGTLSERTTRFGVAPRVVDIKDTQVGCAVEHSTAGWVVRTSTGSSLPFLVSPTAGIPLRMQLVIDPAQAGFLCSVTVAGVTTSMKSEELLPEGTLAMYSDYVFVRGIMVYER